MKFNKYVPLETRMLLERQYKEYIKGTIKTDKEKHAAREWVKDGNSVYKNSCDAWAEARVPSEFLTIYREEEYLRAQTKGMSVEEAERFSSVDRNLDDNDDYSIDSDQDVDLPFE